MIELTPQALQRAVRERYGFELSRTDLDRLLALLTALQRELLPLDDFDCEPHEPGTEVWGR